MQKKQYKMHFVLIGAEDFLALDAKDFLAEQDAGSF